MKDSLSLYESEQVRAIAAWKSERPSVLGSVVDGLLRPVARGVCRAVPRSVIDKAVGELDRVAFRDEGLAEVARMAGVADVQELRYSPMKECDALASRISIRSERAAIVEGALEGVGGVLVAEVLIPIQLVAALRTICRIGHCYGYPLDGPGDRAYVLGVLEVSTLDDPGRRQRVLDRLDGARGREGDAGPATLCEVVTSVVEEQALDAIPMIGSVATFALDYSFMHGVTEAARRVFQERWLRDNGKAATIAPAPSRRRDSLGDVAGALGQAAYVGGGALGFGAALPFVTLARVVARGDHAAARGLRDGARAAAHAADQFLAGLLGRDEPGPAPAPAPALRAVLG